jgi:hypothetical protein
MGSYVRIGLSMNDAPDDMHVIDFTSYALGTDYRWRWFRTGAEYELYESTESDYRALRLYQSAMFQIDPVSTFSLDFSESRIEHVHPDREPEESYRLTSRYRRSLSGHLGFTLEAGAALRRGQGVDQFLATVRPSIRYVVGRTSFEAGYDFEYADFQGREERQKMQFTTRLRRYF